MAVSVGVVAIGAVIWSACYGHVDLFCGCVVCFRSWVVKARMVAAVTSLVVTRGNKLWRSAKSSSLAVQRHSGR